MERDCNSQDKPQLEQKGACGRALCQVQKILQSREEPTPEADTEEDTGILTNLLGLGGLFSPPLVPLLKKGPQGQLCRHEEQAAPSLSVSIWCPQKSAKLLCCPRPLTLSALQHSFSLGRRSSGLDPFLPQLCPVQGG